MNAPILGWDVGGANVKAVRIHSDGETEWPEPAVAQRPFALWREPRRLPAVLREIANRLAPGDFTGEMAVTMTAELADCFPTKRDGVKFVLDAFGSAFPRIEPWVYGVDGQFRSVQRAREEPLQVSAANWMASATLVARAFPEAILLDVGSTTTDIIPIVGGRVVARGRTDAERLTAGELVYTGALRTPVCAIVRSVPFGGRRCRIASECFAIAADVHLWLGRIEASDYSCETPDGRGRTRQETGARLARMVCADFEALGTEDITSIAAHVARAQANEIRLGIQQVCRSLEPVAPSTAVLAGEGAFLARTAASSLTIRDFAEQVGLAASRAWPAAAVAYLLRSKTVGPQGLPRL